MTLRYSFQRLRWLLHLSGFGGEDDIVKLVTFVIDGLQGGEGDKGYAALVALVFVQSRHPVSHTADVDKLAYRFGM